MRIVQLPPAIANQIAAGEVIERPASVVKELLENSLDAGATIINIEINYGGLNQIKISDNGFGIVAEDLPLAIAAHATSKITTLADLYAITSMGFRGEALASIASVAKLTISSKPAQQEHAMMLSVKGTQLSITPCARTTGTTIDVSDLFFNVPVRKRFLKSERLEFQAIEGVVKRFALSAPHIALVLKHNNKLIFSLPAALNEQAKELRMTKVLGSPFVKNAIFLDVEQSSMQLYGWISGLKDQRSQNDRQWVYINHRMVKDKLINHALKQAYDGSLHPGRFPSCLLYFTINSAEVDVNVHPTKHEVRFQQPRLIHDFFVSQLSKAIQSEGLPHGMEFNQSPTSRSPSSNTELREVTSNYRVMKGPPSFYNQPPPFNDYDGIPWTILNKHYSVLWIKQEPYLVDIGCLYQQWLQKQMIQDEFSFASRPLLVTINYPLANKIISEELQRLIPSVGIIIEVKDEEMIIRSIPIAIPYLDLKLFFDGLLELRSYSLAQLQYHLVAAQLIDAHQLSREERMELSQYLMHLHHNEHHHSLLFKPLTVDTCRMFLNV
jgi:DNA mismatch repair protein MutL